MLAYDCILFDADHTLFDFDAYSGLRRMFGGFQVEFSEQHFQDYESANQPLWLQYQSGAITAAQLQVQRFQAWADQLGVPALDLNSAFLDAMAQICAPLDGAVQLLDALRDRVRLGIITNGFSQLQRARLQRTGLEEHFHCLVISEEVGFAKPHLAIFEHALALLGNPVRSRVLMVGDNADTDIRGGILAGLDTCWLNPHGRAAPEDVQPTYQVSRLTELQDLLLGVTPVAGTMR